MINANMYVFRFSFDNDVDIIKIDAPCRSLMDLSYSLEIPFNTQTFWVQLKKLLPKFLHKDMISGYQQLVLQLVKFYSWALKIETLKINL